MTPITKTNTGITPFRSLLSEFLDSKDFFNDNFWNKSFVPAVNVSETDKSYQVEVAAPGMAKDDFKIKIENGVITISAEKNEEKEESDKNYTRQEYNYSSFTRAFTLPEDVAVDDVKAQYENGVLKLNIARKAVAVKSKQITVV